MTYKKLSRQDFDAIVTGELAHYAIWFDDFLSDVICQYFFGMLDLKNDDFKDLILRRDGITFNTKIDIVTKLIDKDKRLAARKDDLKLIFKTMENLKRLRNAMAHGLDMGGTGLELNIEITNSAGKKSLYKITPSSHEENIEKFRITLEKAEEVLADYKNPFQT